MFAIVGQLGTEHNEAIRPYMNARKVPQILNATGASTWFNDYRKYPWTGGWFPDYEFEARLYGQAIARNSPDAKIAVLLQNDSFGEDNLRGLRNGLGAKASNIAAIERFEPTAADVRSQIARLRASGATVFFIVATPRYTIQAYAFANALGWRPAAIYTTLVSATDTILSLAQRSGGGDLVNNTISAAYLKDPANPKWDNDAGMKLYKQVMAKYYPSGNVKDGLNFYGVAAAHAFVQLMYKAGRNPTRASLMKAYRTWTETTPFLLPGNRIRTGGADQRPIDCLQLAEVQQRRVPAGVVAHVPVRDVRPGSASSVRCFEGREDSRPSRVLMSSGGGTAPSTAPSSSAASRRWTRSTGATLTARTIHSDASSPTSSTLRQPGACSKRPRNIRSPVSDVGEDRAVDGAVRDDERGVPARRRRRGARAPARRGRRARRSSRRRGSACRSGRRHGTRGRTPPRARPRGSTRASRP